MRRASIPASLLLIVPGMGLCGTISPTQHAPAIFVAAAETLGSSQPAAFPPALLSGPIRSSFRVDDLTDLSGFPEALRDTAQADPERAALDAVTQAIDPLGASDRALALASGPPTTGGLLAQLLANAPAALLRTLRAGRLDPISTGSAAQATETGLDARMPELSADLPPLPEPPARAESAEGSGQGVDARAVLIGVAVLLITVVGVVLAVRRPDKKPRLRTYRERARTFNANARPPGVRLPPARAAEAADIGKGAPAQVARIAT